MFTIKVKPGSLTLVSGRVFRPFFFFFFFFWTYNYTLLCNLYNHQSFANTGLLEHAEVLCYPFTQQHGKFFEFARRMGPQTFPPFLALSLTGEESLANCSKVCIERNQDNVTYTDFVRRTCASFSDFT